MGYYTLLFGKREEVRYELPEENCTAQTRLIPDFGKLSLWLSALISTIQDMVKGEVYWIDNHLQ